MCCAYHVEPYDLTSAVTAFESSHKGLPMIGEYEYRNIVSKFGRFRIGFKFHLLHTRSDTK